MKAERLKALVDQTLRCYQSWGANQDVREISEELEDAIDAMLLGFQAIEAPQEYQAVARVVENIVPEWQAWKDQVALRGTEGVFPGKRWFNAMTELGRAWITSEKVVLNPLEPVSELMRQGVSPRQIALIWGFELPNGQPDMEKVFQEAANPGTHTKGVDPRVRKAQEARERQIAEMEEIIERRRKERERVEQAAPEGLGQLIKEAVSVRQIKKMIPGVTDEQIRAMADSMGLPPPDVDYAPVQSARAPHEPEISEADKTAMDAILREANTVEVEEEVPEAAYTKEIVAEVMAHKSNGLTDARRISREMSGRLTTKQVRDILETMG